MIAAFTNNLNSGVTRALDDVNLTIHSGEKVVVCGRTGR